jgi:hypothetical protein
MKIRLLFLLSATTILLFPKLSFGQAPPPLGAARSFALFTAVGAVKNSGPTIINGDIGTNAGAFEGFPPGVINGTIHIADAVATNAATDVQTAYGLMSAIPYANTLALYGGTPPVTLIPGSYTVGGASTLAGTLILDGGGDPNAKFYLQVTGALTTAAGSLVLTQNGANPENVYWQIGGLTTLGRNSVMRGNLLVDGSIIMIEGAVLQGRGLSRAGAITIDTNEASLPDAFVAPVLTSTFWLGNRTMDWFTDSNWSNGVPTSTLNAIVPTNTAPYPVIGNGNAEANGLTIGTGASLTQSGGTLDLKGNLSNSGTISATAGSVTMSSGTATQIIGGNGSSQFWDLTVANTFGASQAGALSIHGALALPSGNLTTNGRPMTLLSDANGTGLVVNGGGVVNGAATVQRYITPTPNAGLGYRQYSSPVQNAQLSGLATTGFTPIFTQAYNTQGNTATPFPNVFEYREDRVTSPDDAVSAFDQGFYVPLATDLMTVMGGYSVNINANQVVALRGTLNNGELTRNNLSRGDQPQSGWHLLGNPYPSPIDFSQTEGLTRSGMDNAIYISQSLGTYTGEYRSYVNGQGGDPVLPAMQAFFTRVNDDATTGSFGLNNNIRVTTSELNPAFQRGSSDSRPVVQLRLKGSNATLADNVYVYFEQGATSAFDSHFDAYKLSNSSGLNIGSIAAGKELSISGLPLLSAALTVPLNVRVPATGSYTLNAAKLANFAPGTDVFLLDTQTGSRVNLSQQPAYTFTAAATTLTGRFSLYFSTAGALATQNTSLAAQVQLFPNPAHGSFALLLPAELGRTMVNVSLLNPLGQVVSQRKVNMTAAGATTQFNVSSLAQGVYSLRITSGTTQVVKRVVVE